MHVNNITPVAVAAPCRARSRGPVHRDMHVEIGAPITIPRDTMYTVLLCLTDVTMENGTVQLWPRSAYAPTPHAKDALRTLRHHESLFLTAKSRTCFVFDRSLCTLRV